MIELREYNGRVYSIEWWDKESYKASIWLGNICYFEHGTFEDINWKVMRLITKVNILIQEFHDPTQPL